MKTKQSQQKQMTGLLMGAAAGAALSAAGMYLAGQQSNQKQMKQLAKKAAHGVENAVNGLGTMLGDYLPR